MNAKLPPARPDLDAVLAAVAGRYAGGSRWAAGYVAGKLRRDPATRAILEQGLRAPLGEVVDLGCGRGQVAIALLEAGLAERVTGYDIDIAKLEEARRAASGLAAAFVAADLSRATLPPCDTVLMVDALYQIPEAAQPGVLQRLAAAARRRVLLRLFDPARGWRSRLGLAMEGAARRFRGDAAAIAPMPLASVARPLQEAGFVVSIEPCWKGTPLPNVLLLAERTA